MEVWVPYSQNETQKLYDHLFSLTYKSENKKFITRNENEQTDDVQTSHDRKKKAALP